MEDKKAIAEESLLLGLIFSGDDPTMFYSQ
jgi:hypothetical protein